MIDIPVFLNVTCQLQPKSWLFVQYFEDGFFMSFFKVNSHVLKCYRDHERLVKTFLDVVTKHQDTSQIPRLIDNFFTKILSCLKEKVRKSLKVAIIPEYTVFSIIIDISYLSLSQISWVLLNNVPWDCLNYNYYLTVISSGNM